MDVADRNGFAVCYPQGLKDPKGNSSWNVGYPSQEGMKTDDVDFIVKLSRHISREFGLSRENIFLTGMSNGGEMCYLTAQKKPKAFKAIASIAGLTLTDMMPLRYRRPVPFMEVHGTEDRTSEWTGDPENNTTSPRASKVTIRKRGVPVATAARATASLSTTMRTSTSWRNSTRARM